MTMKKLGFLLLMGLCSLNLPAQVKLEGKFDHWNPVQQQWDGRYLLYTFRGDAFIYDTQTSKLHKESNVQVPDLHFRDGLYFRLADEGYVLRKVGEDEPILPQRFSWVSDWFGDSFMAWEEVTGPGGGVFGYWYQMDKGIETKHSLEDIHKAVRSDLKATADYGRKSSLESAIASFSMQYQEGLIAFSHPESGKVTYFDYWLNPKITGDFVGGDPFFEGFAAVKNEIGLWGFIDKTGKTKIPFIYLKKPGPFHSGLAKVENKEGLFGFIDFTGALVIPPVYLSVSNFYQGKALARKGYGPKGLVFLNQDGSEEIFPCQSCELPDRTYRSIYSKGYFFDPLVQDYVDDGMIVVKSKNQNMLLDASGKVILDERHAWIMDLVEGKVIIVVGNHFGEKGVYEFYLWDLASNSPTVSLGFDEF